MTSTTTKTAATRSATPPASAAATEGSRRRRPKPPDGAPAGAAPDPEAAGPVAPAGRQTKAAAIVALLARPEGAAIGELTAATGWRAHSVRAALTGLRQRGRGIARSRDDAGVSRYRLVAGA